MTDENSGWKEECTVDGQAYYFNENTFEATWDKPWQLMSHKEQKAGEWFWVPHQQDSFKPGVVLQELGNGGCVCELEDGEEVNVKKNQMPLIPLSWAQLQRITPDLVMLEEMNEALILHTLADRFNKEQIYTNVGTILVVINPYKFFDIYTEQLMDKYKARGRALDPHIYTIANDAFSFLCDTSANQSVLISGESGAGKTVATKHCLSFLARVAGGVESVQDRILQCNPILEAFGNAKTVRNDNSSRFGKYIEIFFDQGNKIAGATNTNYLLEKIRVVKIEECERNFHIFYQLAKGATAEQKKKYFLAHPDSWLYLNRDSHDVEGMDDLHEFSLVEKAFQALGFSTQEHEDVLRTVAFVLHLGNMEFDDKGEKRCELSAKTAFGHATELLGVSDSSAEFEKTLVSRELKIPGRGSTTITFSSAEAGHNRDSLAKFVYAALFDWIVKRCNQSIAVGSKKRVRAKRTIGILDIFGFEIFETNSLEQLFINYTNEKLQRFFNQHTFNLEEKIYQREKVKFEHIKYKDNQPVLDLIEKRPWGVIFFIDEELRTPQGSDLKFTKKMHEKYRVSDVYKENRANVHCFEINHYAGRVVYNTENWMEKNRDTLSEDFVRLLSSSKWAFVKTIFPALTAMLDTKTRKQTLGFQFTQQLDQLMAALQKTHPHYVRCIKPNAHKEPLEFDPPLVLEQLTYSGVFEAVEIRKKGFPFKLLYSEFFFRYRCVKPGIKAGRDYSNTCMELVEALHLSDAAEDGNMMKGKTMLLYRGKQHQTMELRRYLCIDRDSRTLQRHFRGCLTRRITKRMNVARDLLRKAIKARNLAQLKKEINASADVVFPMFVRKQSMQLRDLIIREMEIDATLKKLMDNPMDKVSQLKQALADAADIDFSSSWVSKGRCTVRFKTALDEFDRDEINVAMSEAKSLGIAANSDMVRDFQKAVQVLDRIKQEEEHMTKLKNSLRGAGRLQNGSKSTLNYTNLNTQLSSAKSFGMRTPEGRSFVALGDQIVTLRRALSLSLGSKDDGKWGATWSALEAIQQAYPSLFDLGLGLEQETDAVAMYKEVLDTFQQCIPTRSPDKLEEALAKAKEWHMPGDLFPVVKDGQDTLDRIRALQAQIKSAMDAVMQAQLEKAVSDCEAFGYAADDVDACAALRDHVIELDRQAQEALDANPCLEEQDMQRILTEAQGIRMSTSTLSQLQTLLDNVHANNQLCDSALQSAYTWAPDRLRSVLDRAQELRFRSEALDKLRWSLDDCLDCTARLQTAISERNQEDLESLLEKANNALRMGDAAAYPIVPESQKCLKRILELRELLTTATERVIEKLLREAITACDEFEYSHKEYKATKDLRDRVIRQNELCREALEAASTYAPPQLEEVLSGARSLKLHPHTDLNGDTQNWRALQKRLEDCVQCTKDLEENIDKRLQEEIERLQQVADGLRMNDSRNYPVIQAAADCIKRIKELQATMQNATDKVEEALLRDAVAQCEEYRYTHTQQFKNCLDLRDRVIACNDRCSHSLHDADSLSPSEMKDILDTAMALKEHVSSPLVPLITDDLKTLDKLLADCEKCMEDIWVAVEYRNEGPLRQGLQWAGQLKMHAHSDPRFHFEEVPAGDACLAKIMQLRGVLDDAEDVVEEQALINAIAVCEEYGYENDQVEDVRQLRDRVIQLNKEAVVSVKELHPKIMSDILSRADRDRLQTDNIRTIRQLLMHTDDEAFVQKQLRAAVALIKEGRTEELERKKRLTFVLKDLLFLRRGGEFEINRFGKALQPSEWADFKLISTNKEKLVASYYNWVDGGIHHSLTDLPERNKEIKDDPDLNSEAKKIFDHLRKWMGDSKYKKDMYEAKGPIDKIIGKAIAMPRIRDEIYCQIIKQMTNNKTAGGQGMVKGWQLLMMCLDTFPPVAFENYLEYWIRKNGSIKEVDFFHNVVYNNQPKTVMPAASQLRQFESAMPSIPSRNAFPIPHPWTGSKPDLNKDTDNPLPAPQRSRRGVLSSTLSSARPRKLGMAPSSTPRPAVVSPSPQPEAGAAPQLPPMPTPVPAPVSEPVPVAPKEECPWGAVLDEESGDIYYYHKDTGETTWDRPADYWE